VSPPEPSTVTFDEQYFNIGYLDRLSYQDTFIHRLDPRSKVAATFLFIVVVVSFPQYQVAALIPFFLFPAVLMTLGDIPLKFVLTRVLLVSPFAVFIGIFNPLLDEKTVMVVSGIPISGGWLSFLSILIKSLLTISAGLLLIATTSFYGVCHALRWLRVPAPFIAQLLFLYRYLFLMMEETMRIIRARDMRSFGKHGTGIQVFVQIVGTLFIRTIERAERIYYAMLSRGFDGEMPLCRRLRFTLSDAVFVLMTLAFLLCFRFFPVSETIGGLARRLLG
jgi:cobalt/nickel transport system permease protein